LPTGALRATKENRARFENMKVELEARNLEQKGEAEKIAQKLDGQSFAVLRQAAEGGQLYGSVSPRDLAVLVGERGFAITRAQIALNTPIKTIGLHKVPISLHPEIEATIQDGRATQMSRTDRARGEDGHARKPRRPPARRPRGGVLRAGDGRRAAREAPPNAGSTVRTGEDRGLESPGAARRYSELLEAVRAHGAAPRRCLGTASLGASTGSVPASTLFRRAAWLERTRQPGEECSVSPAPGGGPRRAAAWPDGLAVGRGLAGAVVRLPCNPSRRPALCTMLPTETLRHVPPSPPVAERSSQIERWFA
jgi:large subunit ribosomal protein L9